MSAIRTQLRKTQRAVQKRFDKEALEKMDMPKGLRQFFKRHGYGAERILATYKQYGEKK